MCLGASNLYLCILGVLSLHSAQLSSKFISNAASVRHSRSITYGVNLLRELDYRTIELLQKTATT